KNGDTIGPRFACGFSAMVNLNDAGQAVFDALGPEHHPAWTPNTPFTISTEIHQATGSRLLDFFASNTGTSGATEPVWPTSPGQQVVDGTITWVGAFADCDEDDHGIVRFTSGTGNELLVAQGSTVGTPASTVSGFGSDDDSAATN